LRHRIFRIFRKTISSQILLVVPSPQTQGEKIIRLTKNWEFNVPTSTIKNIWYLISPYFPPTPHNSQHLW
jgi:hypothetical protein